MKCQRKPSVKTLPANQANSCSVRYLAESMDGTNNISQHAGGWMVEKAGIRNDVAILDSRS